MLVKIRGCLIRVGTYTVPQFYPDGSPCPPSMDLHFYFNYFDFEDGGQKYYLDINSFGSVNFCSYETAITIPEYSGMKKWEYDSVIVGGNVYPYPAIQTGYRYSGSGYGESANLYCPDGLVPFVGSRVQVFKKSFDYIIVVPTLWQIYSNEVDLNDCFIIVFSQFGWTPKKISYFSLEELFLEAPPNKPISFYVHSKVHAGCAIHFIAFNLKLPCCQNLDFKSILTLLGG